MDKIAIFSDVHFGLDGNSDQRLDDAMNAVSWVCRTASEKGISGCVFAGDWFHSRGEIDVKTALKAKESVAMCSETFRDGFYMIAGNHDYYYISSSSVSSVSLFSEYGNVHLVVDEPEVIDVNGKKVLLAPWFFDPSSENRKFDAMIGHFEYVGGRMTSGFSKSGHNPADMLNVAPTVFTGHLHLTNDDDRSNGKIVVIGSTYQQDWGDCGDEKRMIIFDGSSYESVYNDVSPKYRKVSGSKLLSVDDDTLKKVFRDKIGDCFVKIVNDVGNESLDRLMSIVDIVSDCGNRKVEIDNANTVKSVMETMDMSLDDLASKNVRSYVCDFISRAIDSMPEYSDVDKDAATSKAMSYFNVIDGAKEAK